MVARSLSRILLVPLMTVLISHAVWAKQAVDLELVMATDVSRSIDQDEAKLQRQGIADAFRSKSLRLYPQAFYAVLQLLTSIIQAHFITKSLSTGASCITPKRRMILQMNSCGHRRPLAAERQLVMRSNSLQI